MRKNLLIVMLIAVISLTAVSAYAAGSDNNYPQKIENSRNVSNFGIWDKICQFISDCVEGFACLLEKCIPTASVVKCDASVEGRCKVSCGTCKLEVDSKGSLEFAHICN